MKIVLYKKTTSQPICDGYHPFCNAWAELGHFTRSSKNVLGHVLPMVAAQQLLFLSLFAFTFFPHSHVTLLHIFVHPCLVTAHLPRPCPWFISDTVDK